MTISITTAGSYPAGDYRLAASVISVSGTDGVTFTGDATLDVNGCTIQNTGPVNNDWLIGISGLGKLVVYNTYPLLGRVVGFRVGVKAVGVGSIVRGVDLSGNRYIGAWILGSDSVVSDNLIASIGGVTDEAYSIGVQCNANRVSVIRNTFKELYRQAGSAPGAVGEGLAINFPADVTGGIAKYNILDNSLVQTHTYFGFSGVNGVNLYESNRSRNAWRFVGMAGTPGSAARNNYAVLETLLSGSNGIGTLDPVSVDGNIMIGYETPYLQAQGRNITMTFPGFPVPPPSVYGTVLDQPLTGSAFGNVTADTPRCVIAPAALSGRKATDCASSSVCFSASGVRMSGLGAPARTITPYPTRAMSVVGPGTKRAVAAASLNTSTGTTATSTGAPDAARLIRLGVESKWITSLCPKACSNWGASSVSQAVVEPPARTLSSAA
jgi:hypothetical protein